MLASTHIAVQSPILGLSHVGVKARDVERSCAFYGDFLGFAEQCRLNYLTTGKLMLVCFKVNDEQWLEVFAGLATGENRMHQVAFRVTDADQVRARLADHHFDVPAKTPTGQMGNLNFVVPDPSGQIIEFVQHLPSGITQRDSGRFLPSTRIAKHLRQAQIVVSDPALGTAFYSPLGLLPSESNDGPAGTLRLRTATGDYVDFATTPVHQSQFTLEVQDLLEARLRLEANRHLIDYLQALVIATTPDGAKYLDLFDPDGTCVRLMEPAPAAPTP
jgi:catechol 2,3-dioxygenase-like lactoylglutathione lyase family enzyme